MQIMDITPVDLLDALAKRVRQEVQGLLYQDTVGKESTVNVYTQELPFREFTDTGVGSDHPVPYVLLELIDGEGDAQSGEAETARAMATICVGNQGTDRQAGRDVMHIMRLVLTDLQKRPVLERAMEFTGQWQWQMGGSVPDVAIGAMLLEFRLGRMEREVQPELEENWWETI